MQESFHLFIRQHANDWLTASVLTHPQYAAFGPALGPLKEQLAEVLAHDLGEGVIEPGDAWFDGIERRTLEVELKAVQHDRLIRVPMRVSLVVRPVPDAKDVFEVRVPRLERVFRIAGAENITPWSEEVVRGFFHLRPVEALLPYQSARGERLDRLEVTWQRAKSRVAKRRLSKRQAAEAEGADDWLDVIGGGSTLASVGVELVAEARAGRLGRAELRDELVEQVLGILDAATGRSVLLTGPTGVGKTAVVHELAHRIAAGRVPARLEGVPIWHVTGGRIIAGMKYLGEWQARCQAIVEEIRGERGILFVESPYELMTAGSHGQGLSVADFLLPTMRSGEVTVLAECTADGLLLAEQTGPAFVDALRRVPVPAFGADEARAILERAAGRLEKQYKVRFSPAGLSRAMDVLARFGDAGAMPGSGLRLIEQMARLPGEARAGSERPVLDAKAAVRAFSRSTGFGEALVDPDVTLDVAAVRGWFDARVVGQPDATELLCDLVMVVKASLDDPERPMGSFLFMGPTGVGKTESALTLAEYLFGDRERVIRFDMSEYGHPGSAARLVGVGRGEGDLTRRVRERPFCVLLLDEVEKADGEVFDVLLQVLGEGRLTDGTGRTVSFAHAIIIMTSNLGAGERRRIGLGDAESKQSLAQHYREAARRFFRPEFINRVDYLVPFAPLSADAVRGIARRMLDGALAREGLSRRGVSVSYRDDVLHVLMGHGFDARYGARPMKRAVEQQVLVPLSRRLVARGDGEAEALVLYGHGARVAVMSSRGAPGEGPPSLGAAWAAGEWEAGVRAARGWLRGWAESAAVRAARGRGEAGAIEEVEAEVDAVAALGPDAVDGARLATVDGALGALWGALRALE
ncbi:MAG: ATP-dependent Clp protease ATP-binding subunit [Myxococcales bacterium]|nr:ATP-dependent Clp protease ATP-binding subunit [Myxococcales bacterium]